MAENHLNESRVVVIGGSAGSLDTVMRIAGAINEFTQHTFILVVHRKNTTDSNFEDLITSKTRLLVKEVEDKEYITTGTIYIAPPDYHLLVEDQHMFSLDSSEKVHYSRPSIDVTFESAALAFGTALTGILLSGANADGAEGIRKIAKAGGYTIVEDPTTASAAYMPQQAINLVTVDAIVPGASMPGYLVKHLLNAGNR
ncbi:chemotaxis protein CheB [Segetibacter sp. 3557_3]|uniref:chemotaxis protein CheB n=1 Tax=Segetibacter sp. 3557_3 TaxID=2547429 RepID=UPI00105846A9|nr:chemotaxis protein CheB [Segetibacter sp. 3557_3]TDH29056.1 chemotaxis protein CheB [Segetibacter sp. 3557_3]